MKICPACAREYADAVPHCQDDGVALVQLATTSNERASDLLGMVVDGRYRLERIVGRGGMGTVYAATHVVVGKEMAIKVLRSGIERSEEILQRFIREAQSANAVHSRHICEMSDFGQLPTGAFYIVMELLDGISLTRALREHRLTRAQVRKVFIQISETLDKAHRANIVHRDLKPDNVVLVEDEGDPYFVKLVDFGIAKMMESKASDLTETGVILGTPYYMSPEQARGDSVDHRSDIYALGVMMYRAFTGKLPFVADTAMGVLTRHLTQKPELPSRVVSTIDPSVEGIILRCLEKKPEDRFQSMATVAQALQQLSDGRVDRRDHPTLDERSTSARATAEWTGTTINRGQATTPHARIRDTTTEVVSDSGVPSAAPSLAFPPVMPLPMAPQSQTGLGRAVAANGGWQAQPHAIPLVTPAVTPAREGHHAEGRPPPLPPVPGPLPGRAHPTPHSAGPHSPPEGAAVAQSDEAAQNGESAHESQMQHPSGQADANVAAGEGPEAHYQPEAYTNRGLVSTRLELPQRQRLPRTGLFVAIGGGLLVLMLIGGVLAAAFGNDAAPTSGPTTAPAAEPPVTNANAPDQDDDTPVDDDEDVAKPDDPAAADPNADAKVPPAPRPRPAVTTPSPNTSASAAASTTRPTSATAVPPTPRPTQAPPPPPPPPPAQPTTAPTGDPPPFQDIRSPFD